MQMNSTMLILPCLLLLPVTDAFVRLHKSILYDEYDFKGVDQISTDMCTAGCKVYATIPTTDEAATIAANILIADPTTNKNTSIADLARRFVRDSQEKDYVEIGITQTLTIFNTNANRESAPLSIWIVSAHSPYYRTAEVFESLNLKRNKGIASAPITILSAYPFTVNVQPGDSNAVYARTTGYDAIDRNAADTCYTAMDNDFGDAFDGFSLAINGPLLTLAFDIDKYPLSAVELSGSSDLKFDLYPFPKQPTFISSPGFVCGCGSSPQSYRSSALSMGNAYTLHTPDDREMVLNFDMDVNTIGGYPVMIYDHKTTLNHPFSGHFSDSTNTEHTQLQTYQATVSFDAAAGGSFGMRVWAYDVGKEPTTVSGVEPTTSLAGSLTFAAIPLLTMSLFVV